MLFLFAFLYHVGVNILSIENLEKTVKDNPLFEHVTLGLDEGEKVGIVGKNGEGKSTFLYTLIGKITPDEGKVSLRNGTRVALLEQRVTYKEGATISSYLYEASDSNIEILNKYKKAIEEGNNKESIALGEIIERDNLWDIERAYMASLTDMGESFTGKEKMESLSGGERKKVALSRVFALKANLVLFDEPTNHLDIESVEYLEKWIKNTPATVIIVTHDRHILSSVCSTIWELDKRHFYRHPGSFTEYLERKEERLVMAEKEQARLKTILRREMVWLMRGPQARTGKDKGRKDRIIDMQSQIKKIRDEKMTEFSSLERRLGKKILDINNIGAKYGDRVLFKDFTYSFTKGIKIGLIGKNGSGKSTLLDILSGLREPDWGSVDIGVNTVFGYYDQMGRELVENKTALEYAEKFGNRVRYTNGEDVSASRFLELFGFPIESQRTPISLLSGGERRRLYLITKLISNPNFLLFDEPTNDLDIPTMENLEDYISSFPGCAIISSHDRTFLDCSVDFLFVIENERITLFPGNYTEYREKKDEEEKEREVEKKKDSRKPREKKGLTFKENKEKESLEEETTTLEKEIKALEDSFSTAENTELGTLKERTKKYEEKKITLDEKTERWLELEEKSES